mmetsp:Transcript_108729/g.306402  ORF Transcript_108729/g.306402 Transcript_108729/m.306402 type:complete len:281 (+) Transcript_108729:444-1286(+)
MRVPPAPSGLLDAATARAAAATITAAGPHDWRGVHDRWRLAAVGAALSKHDVVLRRRIRCKSRRDLCCEVSCVPLSHWHRRNTRTSELPSHSLPDHRRRGVAAACPRRVVRSPGLEHLRAHFGERRRKIPLGRRHRDAAAKAGHLVVQSGTSRAGGGGVAAAAVAVPRAQQISAGAYVERATVIEDGRSRPLSSRPCGALPTGSGASIRGPAHDVVAGAIWPQSARRGLGPADVGPRHLTLFGQWFGTPWLPRRRCIVVAEPPVGPGNRRCPHRLLGHGG